jgi:excinuclease ABC subunit C
VEWQETDSVLEALLLETELIKKYQPKYNSREKDDKSYWYVIITDEDFPRVLPVRGRELLSKSQKGDIFGPFPYASEIKEALKIIRKIFPYRDNCIPNSGKKCFNNQIGLCPGVFTGEISKTNYHKIVRNIKLLFGGKKQEILKNLEKEMKSLAKKQEFEKAGKVRDQIFALNHIRDVSLLKNKKEKGGIRIEAYDIAHLGGKKTVGAMTVWQNGELDKSEYKKFELRGEKALQADDLANLREILERRLNHPEWPWPDIIVVDGNQVQVRVAREVFPDVQIVGVVKDAKHKAGRIIGDQQIIHDYYRTIIEINAEAHRFALSYHRKKMRQIS